MEPFAGSAALFFELGPQRALLADTNEELVLAFSQVRLHPVQLAAALSRLPTGKAAYLRLRSEDPHRLSPLKRAARFIYLNRFSFNGLYRTNRAGAFNVPFGGQRCGELPTSELLTRCSLQLRKAKVLCADFDDTLNRAIEGDFVYIDPPYSVADRRVFKEYSPSTFGEHQVRRLRNALVRLDSLGIPFVLSYYESREADLLAAGFHAEAHEVRRNIAGFAKRRGTITELVIFNKKPPLQESSHA